MLYLTTRNKADSFTAHKVLRSAAAPDGGMFMPMHLPVQDDIALARYERMNFGETVAEIMNIFFGTQLSGWDVDFTIGRQAVDLASIGHKVSVAECWHNPAGTSGYLVQRLYHLVTGDKSNATTPNAWFHVAVNIAILFGMYGKNCRRDIYEFDVAVDTEDMLLFFAVRYAKRMGLPIRKIILGCTDQNGLWDFLSYGDFVASKRERNIAFEALLWLDFGYDEVVNYTNCVHGKATFRLHLLALDKFRKDLFGTVVGDRRTKNVAESAWQTNQYRMEPVTARAFGALQDYRAKTGENKNTLLFAQNALVK